MDLSSLPLLVLNTRAEYLRAARDSEASSNERKREIGRERWSKTLIRARKKRERGQRRIKEDGETKRLRESFEERQKERERQ